MSLYYASAFDDEPEPPPRRLVPARLPPLRPIPTEARPEVLPAVTYHVPRMPYSAWLAAERAAGRPTRPGPQPGNAGITPRGAVLR